MLNEALKLGDPWPHWTDVYKVFGLIQNMYKGKVDVINQKIKEFYNMDCIEFMKKIFVSIFIMIMYQLSPLTALCMHLSRYPLGHGLLLF